MDNNILKGIGIPKKDLQALLESKGHENVREFLLRYHQQASEVLRPDRLGLQTGLQQSLNSMLYSLYTTKCAQLRDYINELEEEADACHVKSRQRIEALTEQVREVTEEAKRNEDELEEIVIATENLKQGTIDLESSCQALEDKYEFKKQQYPHEKQRIKDISSSLLSEERRLKALEREWLGKRVLKPLVYSGYVSLFAASSVGGAVSHYIAVTYQKQIIDTLEVVAIGIMLCVIRLFTSDSA